MNIISTIQKYFLNYKGLPKECWRDIFFLLLNGVSVGICFFLSLYFVDILHFDLMHAGLLMSSYGLGTVFGGFLSGKLCDRFLPAWIAVLSLFLQSAAFLSLIIFHRFEPLMVVLFFLGTSNYSFKTSNIISMLSHCHYEKHLRLKALNISHAASNFGLGISGVIVGVLSSYGYKNIFYMACIILLFSAIYLGSCNLYSIHHTKNTPFRDDQTIVCDLQKAINIKLLILVLLSIFFVGMVIGQLGSTYPVYVKNAFPELGTKAVSILFILDTVLIVFFQAPLSNYYCRFDTVLVMGSGAFLMGLGMLILSDSSCFFWAIISCCIWTTGEMFFIPTAQLLCYEQGKEMKKGESIGIFQSTYAISTVVGPSLGGFVYTKFGANSIWYLSFLIGTICLIFCLFLTRIKKQTYITTINQSS